MDPCPFVRIVIRNLALKFPVPSCTPCFCKMKLDHFATQITSIPLISEDDCNNNYISSLTTSTCFNLNKSQFDKLVSLSSSSSAKKPNSLKIEIYTAGSSSRGNICGLNNGGKLLGSVSLPLNNLKGTDQIQSKGCTIHNGWVLISEGQKGLLSSHLHLNVRAEPDPRFVFQFDGEPECSPQVFQIVNGSVKQPVFTCKFSFRNSADRNLRSRSSLSDEKSSPISWLKKFISDGEKPVKERKGWCITIHDLSGSPVAAASMVTPFVPSPGADRVSRANPGAWLILHASHGTWKPWGRLEAWLERGQLGYRFDLLPDATAGGGNAVTLVNSALSLRNGGKFTIDMSSSCYASQMDSPNSSFDFGSGSGSDVSCGSWMEVTYGGGFVMSSTVEGVGRCSKPEVEVGVEHVTCTEDAAAFVALAAAMDLSVDACRVFSHKLRKELRRDLVV